MSTPKLEHIVGKDGLHRLRLTAANGEIIDNSHEGFSDKGKAIDNDVLVFSASVRRLKLPVRLHAALVAEYRTTFLDVNTVDERDNFNDCRDGKPEADPLRRDRVFGTPADPLEPQIPQPSGVEQIFDPNA